MTQSFALLVLLQERSSEAKLRNYDAELSLRYSFPEFGVAKQNFAIMTQSFALLVLLQERSSEAKLRNYDAELSLRYSFPEFGVAKQSFA